MDQRNLGENPQNRGGYKGGKGGHRKRMFPPFISKIVFPSQ